jgi:hypothetical protein
MSHTVKSQNDKIVELRETNTKIRIEMHNNKRKAAQYKVKYTELQREFAKYLFKERGSRRLSETRCREIAKVCGMAVVDTWKLFKAVKRAEVEVCSH